MTIDLIAKYLGKDISDLIRFSPTMLGELGRFLENGGTVMYGLKNRGSYYKLSYTIKENTITVSESIVIDGSHKGNPLAVIQDLSHEIGHAAFPFKFNLSSLEAFYKSLEQGESIATMHDTKEAYFKNRVKDEGAAITKNIEIRREFLTHRGLDIGLGGDPVNHHFYNIIYDKFGNTPVAWEKIGTRVADKEFSIINNNLVVKKLPKRQNYYDIWDKEFQKLTELLKKN